MAGHSKWSKVTFIKGPLDQKRGQLSPKLAQEFALAFPVRIPSVDRGLILAESRGSLAVPGAVSRVIHRKGRATVPVWAIRGERKLDLVIEAGGEGLTQEDEHDAITTATDQSCAVADTEEAAFAQLSA
ncbi:MAG: hypothetical protein P4L99_15960 [Chthoniobacter sp.]|nr:hypothetical protein [Chthoniobacter sp.]